MADAMSTPRADLRTRAARGVLITSAFMIGLQTLSLVKSFVIAGFLTKSEYGVWGVLIVALGTLAFLKDVGIGDKFVQQDEPDQRHAFHVAFTVESIANAALTLLLLLALPLYALAYGHWQIVLPGLVLIASVPATSFRAVVWIHYREMNYARQRLLQAIDPVVSFAVTLALAVAGLGYWSLVIGFTVGVWAGAAAAAAVSPYRFRFAATRAHLREYFAFSWPLFLANATVIVIPQTTMLVGTRTLGLSGAGIIGLAATVAAYADRVDEVITETLYPAICRVKDRLDLLHEAFVKSNRLDLMWGVPFGVGVALFAPDVVHFGLGKKWEPAIGLIQALGLVSAANHFGYNWTAFLRARGDTRSIATGTQIVVASFVVVTVPLLIAFGLTGFAIGMAANTLVSLVVRAHYMGRLLTGYSLVRQALRAVLPTVPAVAVTLGVRMLEPGSRTLGAAIAEGVAYLLVTAAATLIIERSLVSEVWGYLRGRRRRAVAVV
ncbi:MAG: oligosaccharide flippase family protein [Thermoleophilaceae bacterium]